MLTLSESAKQVGVSRTAIFKAIKAGRLSAAKNDKGHFVIDAAELFRVYAPVNKKTVTSEQPETVVNAELRTRLEMTERLLRQVESERDFLRLRFAELSPKLTHQPEQQPVKSLLFQKLFGKRGG